MFELKKIFFWPCENRAAALYKVRLYEKYPKWWLLFGFILHGKLATCLKKFRSFGIVQHIEKNSK